MLIIPEIVRIVRKKPGIAAAPAGLTLVAASYVSETSVTLTFGRAIEIGAIDVLAVVVNDGNKGIRLEGESATLTSATSVRIDLQVAGDAASSELTLSVAADNGLIAVDGATWSGCSEVALPFGN